MNVYANVSTDFLITVYTSKHVAGTRGGITCAIICYRHPIVQENRITDHRYKKQKVIWTAK